MRHPWATTGRVLLVLIFLVSGIGKLAAPRALAAYAGAHHVPLPLAAVLIAAVIEIAGGILVISGGRRAYYAAIVLAIYLIPVTVFIHIVGGFDAVNVLKNIAIAGGLIAIAAREWQAAPATRKAQAA